MNRNNFSCHWNEEVLYLGGGRPSGMSYQQQPRFVSLPPGFVTNVGPVHVSDCGFSPDAGYSCRACNLVIGMGDERWFQHLITDHHQVQHDYHHGVRKNEWCLERVVLLFPSESDRDLTSEEALRKFVSVIKRVMYVKDFCKFVNEEGLSGWGLFLTGLDVRSKLIDIGQTWGWYPRIIQQGRTAEWNQLIDLKRLKERTQQTGGNQHRVARGSTESCPNPSQSRPSRLPYTQTEDENSWSYQIPTRSVEVNDVYRCNQLSRRPKREFARYAKTAAAPQDGRGEEVFRIPYDREKDGPPVTTPEGPLEPITLSRQMTVLTVSSVPDMSFLQGVPLKKQLQLFEERMGWGIEYIRWATDAVNILTSVINFQFQFCSGFHYEVTPFGSLMTRLGRREDRALQLLVDIEGIDNTEANSEVLAEMINDIRNTIDREQREQRHLFPFANVEYFHPTNTNRLLVLISKRSLEQDIVVNMKFGNILPLLECEIFNRYCGLDPRVRPLTFLLSWWASATGVFQDEQGNDANEQGQYPNQLMMLLTMFYFERNKEMLPSIEQMVFKDTDGVEGILGPFKKVNGYPIPSCSDIHRYEPRLNDGMAKLIQTLNDDEIRAYSIIGLLEDWFKFYSTVVNFKEHTLCLRIGRLVRKKYFHPGQENNLPIEFQKIYAQRRSTPHARNPEEIPKPFWSMSPMSIQHPFDLSINCSERISEETVDRFQLKCLKAFSLLKEIRSESDCSDLAVILSNLTQLPNTLQPCTAKIKGHTKPKDLQQPGRGNQASGSSVSEHDKYWYNTYEELFPVLGCSEKHQAATQPQPPMPTTTSATHLQKPAAAFSYAKVAANQSKKEQEKIVRTSVYRSIEEERRMSKIGEIMNGRKRSGQPTNKKYFGPAIQKKKTKGKFKQKNLRKLLIAQMGLKTNRRGRVRFVK